MQQREVSSAGWAWVNEGVTCFVIGTLAISSIVVIVIT